MKITIESTAKIVEVNGVPARVWQGTTASGIEVVAFITRVAHDANEPEEVAEHFKTELYECAAPREMANGIPSKLIL